MRQVFAERAGLHITILKEFIESKSIKRTGTERRGEML